MKIPQTLAVALTISAQKRSKLNNLIMGWKTQENSLDHTAIATNLSINA